MLVINVPKGTLIEDAIRVRDLEEDHRIGSGGGRLADERHELGHGLNVLEGVTAADQVSRQMGVISVEEFPETGDIHIAGAPARFKAGIDSEAAGARPPAQSF